MEPPSPISLRVATAIDARAVYETCVLAIRASGPHSYSDEQVEAWVRRITQEALAKRIEQLYFLVACQDEEIVGFAALNPTSHELDYVYVHPDFQRKGVGRQLCEAIEQAAKNRRFRALHLVASLNALRFYERLNYKTEKTIIRDLDGIKVPCVLMKKRL